MDDAIRILSTGAVPSALDALDERVLHALAARRRETAAIRRTMAFAVFLSLGGGIVAGSMFVPAAVAASPLMPLVPVDPLAPSTILDSR